MTYEELMQIIKKMPAQERAQDVTVCDLADMEFKPVRIFVTWDIEDETDVLDPEHWVLFTR